MLLSDLRASNKGIIMLESDFCLALGRNNYKSKRENQGKCDVMAVNV